MSEFVFELPDELIESPVGSTPAPGVIDYVARAIDRMPQQHKTRPNVQAFLRASCGALAPLAQAISDCLLLRSIDTAIGAQLDVLGRLVGQPRGAVSDDELYRRYIRARIATNRSRGMTNDLIRITRLVVNDLGSTVTLERQNWATIIVRVAGDGTTEDVSAILISFLRQAKGAGVRLVLESSTAADADRFTFDSGPGLDVGVFANGWE